MQNKAAMKTHFLKHAGFLFFLFLLPFFRVGAQVMYTYPLTNDFKGQPATAPDLIQIPNNSGLTGNFTERNVPSSTCGQTGIARGYFFGLREITLLGWRILRCRIINIIHPLLIQRPSTMIFHPKLVITLSILYC